MSEVIRLFGANYHFIEKWGIPAIIVIAGCVAISIFKWRWTKPKWINGLLKSTVMLSTFAIIVLVIYVKSYVEPLVVPEGYSIQGVDIVNGGIKLKGEILYKEVAGSPAAVFISGSDISSYHTNYARLVNEVITPILSDLGYTILYYDKRGVGSSTGDWMSADFDALSDDAMSATRFLKSMDWVDKEKIIVIGHSQGGWIAQLTASRDTSIAAMISLAGPATTVKEQIMDDELGGLLCDGVDSLTALKEVTKEIELIENKSMEAVDGRYLNYRLTQAYNPSQAILNVHQPALYLFAENDRLVPAKKNIARLQELFGGHVSPNITLSTIPGAGHSFRLMDFCNERDQRDMPYSEDFLLRLKGWLSTLH